MSFLSTVLAVLSFAFFVVVIINILNEPIGCLTHFNHAILWFQYDSILVMLALERKESRFNLDELGFWFSRMTNGASEWFERVLILRMPYVVGKFSSNLKLVMFRVEESISPFSFSWSIHVWGQNSHFVLTNLRSCTTWKVTKSCSFGKIIFY